MVRRLHRLLLRIYRRFPTLVRRWVVRTISPNYTVGAMCIVERDDGAILFVRHSYRNRWGVPGGLLQRREAPADGVRREVAEEVALDVELIGQPTIVVDPVPQRIDLVFRARPTDGDSVTPSSPEIVEARWFAPDALPELQFETTGAMVALARAANAPAALPLDPPPHSETEPGDRVGSADTGV